MLVLDALQTTGLNMPRVMIKGGVWRNTEDEIMKVSVDQSEQCVDQSEPCIYTSLLGGGDEVWQEPMVQDCKFAAQEVCQAVQGEVV